jgi:hypothetical protein
MARRRVTAKQRAASKRNLIKARARRSRGRKVAIAGGVAAAVVGVGTAAYVKHDRKHNINLYHNTKSRAQVRSIKKHGFKGASSDYDHVGTTGRVYFSTKKGSNAAYGKHTVKVKMSRVKYAKVSMGDTGYSHTYRGPKPTKVMFPHHVSVHASDLRGHRVRTVPRAPRLRKR